MFGYSEDLKIIKNSIQKIEDLILKYISKYKKGDVVIYLDCYGYKENIGKISSIGTDYDNNIVYCVNTASNNTEWILEEDIIKKWEN